MRVVVRACSAVIARQGSTDARARLLGLVRVGRRRRAGAAGRRAARLAGRRGRGRAAAAAVAARSRRGRRAPREALRPRPRAAAVRHQLFRVLAHQLRHAVQQRALHRLRAQPRRQLRLAPAPARAQPRTILSSIPLSGFPACKAVRLPLTAFLCAAVTRPCPTCSAALL